MSSCSHRRCLQAIRTLEQRVFVTQRQIETRSVRIVCTLHCPQVSEMYIHRLVYIWSVYMQIHDYSKRYLHFTQHIMCTCNGYIAPKILFLFWSDSAEENELKAEMEELRSSLETAKNDLSEATVKLRAMIRAFKESRLLPQPGQFSGVLNIYVHVYLWMYMRYWPLLL